MNGLFSNSNVRRLLLTGVFLLIASLPSFAADPTARIHGTVTDPQGAVVPNTTVTATNQNTGVASTTTTKADGSYEFLSLPIGLYTVSVQATGFQAFKATGIKLDIDTNYLEQVKLAVGSTSDTVNVSAESVQVDGSNMQLNNVVASAQIVELPLLGRDFTQLELIEPGVQAGNDRFGQGRGAALSVNGGQTQQSSYLINGTDTNDLVLNTITFVPSVDALSEFNLITSSLNPEYSRNSGAIVSASVKDGTNQFHGDGFWFYRDTFLNTANFFQRGTSGTPLFHENYFGGTAGGPILRDKLFFFGSYEGERGTVPENPGTQSGAGNVVFSAAQRGGDFSNLLSTTGFSTNPIPASITIPGCTTGVDTFASCLGGKLHGMIPTSAFNSVSSLLLQKFVPLPNADGNTFNFNATTKQVQDQGIGRIDWSPTQKDKIYGIVIIQHAPSSDELSFLGGTVPGFAEVNTREIHQYTADYTHQFGASALNDFSLHYTRFNFGASEPEQVVQPSTLGFNITPQSPQVASVPLITVGNDFILGFSSNGPQPRIDQTYQLTDSFSKVIGNHSLKFGYDGRKFEVANPFFGKNNGAFTFADANGVGSGSALVDFLLGIPSTYIQQAGGRIDAFAFENYLYAQDQWKLTPSLTVNYGLGYQIDTGLHNRQFGGEAVNCFVPGEQSTIFPTAPLGLVYPGDPGCNDAQASDTHWKDFGPRIGFAWSPSGSLGFLSRNPGDLSIRAGYGIYYNRTEEEGSLQNLNTFPFGASFTLPPSQHPQFANPLLDINNGPSGFSPFPFTFPKPGDKNIDFGNQFFFISQYGPGYRPSSAQNFNLTIQRRLPSATVLTVSYVGSLGRHLQTTLEGNPITQAGHDACLNDPLNGTGNGCADPGNRDNQNILFPSHVAHPVVAPAGDVNAGLNIIPADGLISSTGTSNYNALQVSAEKASTHGLFFQASYTYAHALDQASGFESSGFGGQGATTARGFNRVSPGASYGNADFDVRHRFVFSPVYEVPGLRGTHPWVNMLAGGWQISAITTLASGFPIDPSYGGFSTSRSLFCAIGGTFYACPDAPNQVAPVVHNDPRAGTPGANFGFNISSFASEPLGQFGNAARNSIKGYGINNTNMVVSKNFHVPGRESMRLQLRLESDNVFNHTQFNNPDGNFANPGTFGLLRSAAPGRQSQLGAKFYF